MDKDPCYDPVDHGGFCTEVTEVLEKLESTFTHKMMSGRRSLTNLMLAHPDASKDVDPDRTYRASPPPVTEVRDGFWRLHLRSVQFAIAWRTNSWCLHSSWQDIFRATLKFNDDSEPADPKLVDAVLQFGVFDVLHLLPHCDTERTDATKWLFKEYVLGDGALRAPQIAHVRGTVDVWMKVDTPQPHRQYKVMLPFCGVFGTRYLYPSKKAAAMSMLDALKLDYQAQPDGPGIRNLTRRLIVPGRLVRFPKFNGGQAYPDQPDWFCYDADDGYVHVYERTLSAPWVENGHPLPFVQVAEITDEDMGTWSCFRK
jgi:hypothetical protein